MIGDSRQLKIKDVFSASLLSCDDSTSLYDALIKMRQYSVSSIFVTHDGEIIGIWTESDCVKLDLKHINLLQLPIGEVMTSPVYDISLDKTLSEATIKLHQLGIRHLLVKDLNNTPVGVVSLSDIVRNQGLDHYLHFRPIEDHFDKTVSVLDSAQCVSEAIEQMRRDKATAVLVYHRQQQEYGIITQRDIAYAILDPQWQMPCWELASYPMLSMTPDESLFDAYRKMTAKSIRHLVIREKVSNDVIGLLALKNVLTEIETAYCSELENVLAQRDIALRKSEKNLYLANRIIDASLDGIMITRGSGEIIQINPAFSALTGYQDYEVIGKKPSLLSSGMHDQNYYDKMWAALKDKGVWQGEICNKKKSGDIYVEWLTIIEINDPYSDETLYAAIFSDITERKNAEEKIARLAYFDELTGLPNRRLFYDRLSMALASAHRDQHKLSVMFIDLDRFKEVNDTLGHSAGDKLLTQVSERIKGILKEGDTLARLGGDEFVVLLTEVSDMGSVVSFADKLLLQFNKSFDLGNIAVAATASLGASMYPDDGLDSESLLKHADVAMYRSKELGRNSFQMYKASMNARSLERLSMQSRFQSALENGEFELYFQPLQCLVSGRITSLECLLRWHDPNLGMISPAQFIPLAEELGLIVKLDEWVIDRACAQLAHWRRLNIDVRHLAINVSAQHLTQGDLAQTLSLALAKYKLHGHQIELELTEGCFISNFQRAKEVLTKVKKMGVSIALDDFGTGYSALSYLTKLPIDILKIDPSFIAKIPDEYGNSEIVSAIVAMAKALKLHVVAEGVEKHEQMRFLQKLGCHAMQGYLYCKPLSQTAWCEFYQAEKLIS
ncbi:EAL domain-containing protein [Pseudoalteromonas luteoviolacea]|uniref:cyclic-guanylate-specific phosphodiesterase n=1 Tax=Pseudoalteromonas luteoviolacea S4054 TaxID=1129367 RepID=A0A0F6ACD1_9GAMM|nr:EAL domain-containing protein [Pseudoalteromonas luteoviolacea]AOT09613.1 histidine kinase [Pseudoalteromonas luteoviolacea]AOT14525.1 histidine kinase [Pseudoalteromonas luteoviolacea]AOT19440.1 histidine kinase [Pseudoalteromonas luteoviolacea]KKE83872.1 histidine kinase [Pseudoalteromonas luteoviolacea S4054]KZN77266.1 histidine kinase [Pseudoalteromonas luteoviolacea S4047-1]